MSMHLFINGLGASAGGGLTYLRNVVPHLAAREDVRTTLALNPEVAREFRHSPQLSLVSPNIRRSVGSRFWYEQTVLPQIVAGSGAHVLISAGNFALRNSPIPQILLSRNSLYVSQEFYRDLLARRELTLWMDTRAKALLAKRSIHWADCTIAPSEAFARELRSWSGRPVLALHHGFDHQRFVSNKSSLSAEQHGKLDAAAGYPALLFVSHYNYYRNFETLLRAVALLRERPDTRNVRLILTCSLGSASNPGSYRGNHAAALVRELDLARHIVELGTVPYESLHHLYRACDMYATPAYAESFAHPLVEAMSAGLPVVASDLPVHREICRDAAVYFPHHSPQDLADNVTRLVQSPENAKQLAQRGRERSLDFSWRGHVDRLIAVAGDLSGRTPLQQAGRGISDSHHVSTVA